MTDPWDPADAGALRLPSGRLTGAAAYGGPLPPGPAPTLAAYLLGTTPPAVTWDSR